MLLRADQLRRVDSNEEVDAGVLVLHGGTDNKAKAARPARRSFPAPWIPADRVAQGVVKRTRSQRVGVWTLRHRLAGWDRDDDPTPVLEARAAIDAIDQLHHGLPVVLVGHSMGGRTAVCVADSPHVRGVIGLAPWLPESQSADPLRDRHLRIAHARLDHECPLGSMWDFLTRALSTAASVEVQDMGWDLHYLLLERRWRDYAATQVLAILSRTS